MREKPKIMPGVTQPSAPPESSTSASPARISARRIAERIGRTGTSGRQHVADATQPERDRHLARDHPDDADGDGVRRDVLAAGGEEVAVLRLADVDAAAAAADDDAGVRLVDAKASVVPRLACRNDGRGAPRVNSACGSAREWRSSSSSPSSTCASADRDRRYRRSHLARERRDVELGDRARGGNAAADVVPEPLSPDTERRHDADARDHDPRDGHGLTIIPADA